MTKEHETLAAQLQSVLGDAYQIDGVLGSGGFAVVFRVRDVRLGRSIAVKVLSPDVISSKVVLERFRREAETVARLSHAHIVPVYFTGHGDDLVYIAMECVEGYSLADLLARTPQMPVGEAVRILREVASALGYAHARGVVHRDVKPHNILIQADTGRALVTDFGIARTADSAGLTSTGMLVGTPAYLSPEQVAGGESDHRADIYALGVMAYEMLAGTQPFVAATPTATILKRLGAPPPDIRSVRTDVPSSVAAVIARCLAVDVADRYDSAVTVASDLDTALRAAPAERARDSQSIPSNSRTLTRAIALASAVVAIGGVAFVLRARDNAPHNAAATEATLLQDTARVPALPSDMVVIPGGAYPVGTDSGPALAKPRHLVTLSRFAIDRTETTVAAYSRFAREQGLPATSIQATDTTRPVTGIGFSDAAHFCAWRTAGGRLPTEFEWEASAAGERGTPFPWGDSWDSTRANTASTRARRASPAPMPVGSMPLGATPRGVVDLIGNVWEWTQSALLAYPGGTAPANGRDFRVIRGGAFNSPDSVATTWFRGYQRPESKTPAADFAGTGFRCVVSLDSTSGR